MVGIELMETFNGHSVVNASSILLRRWTSISGAETEVVHDGVGEFKEFIVVNHTWGLGVDLCSGFFDPFPLFSSDGVFLGCSELLKSDLDFII